MHRRPLNSSDSVVRETPEPSAAFVTDKPWHCIQNSRMTSPGWGGLCMTAYFRAKPLKWYKHRHAFLVGQVFISKFPYQLSFF